MICFARILNGRAERKGAAACCSAAFVVLCALVSGISGGFCQGFPEALQSEFREGVAAQKAGCLQEAERAYLDVLRKGGTAAFVHNNLGIVYQSQGKQGLAIAQFREAIRLQPNYEAPRVLLGASLIATGQWALAIKELQAAVRLDPREPLARLQLAKACELSGDYAEVVKQYEALHELAPKEPEYLYQLGRAYLRQAQWSMEQIEHLHPGSARLYQMLAESYEARGRTREAIRAFQRAAQIEPKLPGIHLELARVYLRGGKVNLAREELRQELAIVPESVAARKLDQSLPPPKP